MAEAGERARETPMDAESGADNADGPPKECVATDGGGFIPKRYAESGSLRAFRRFSSIPVVIIGAMLVVSHDLGTGAAEPTSRVWRLTAESTVLCKVRAAKLWDVVFGEQLWRALGYVVVVTLGLIVGGAVVGALVLRYCEAGGIGDLALHVSCKPLLLVTLLSAIGKQCVRSLFGRSAAWNVRSPRTQVLDYADCASSCARPLNGAERGLLPGCRRTTATLARADVLVVA
jgi:hypothetical protein